MFLTIINICEERRFDPFAWWSEDKDVNISIAVSQGHSTIRAAENWRRQRRLDLE